MVRRSRTLHRQPIQLSIVMSLPVLVSSCLLGLATRYDGKSKRNDRVINYLRENDLTPIPVCPEQLAGLPTPRPRTFFSSGCGHEILDGSGCVVNEHGTTMNDAFIRGAVQTLQVARLSCCRLAILKERSPSCGVHQVYRQETRIDGEGVTCALLKSEGIEVISEEDL